MRGEQFCEMQGSLHPFVGEDVGQVERYVELFDVDTIPGIDIAVPSEADAPDLNTASLVVGGAFRDTVQFDPRNIPAPVQADGLDGFVNLFDPNPDPDVSSDDEFHVTLLLPNIHERSKYRHSVFGHCEVADLGLDRVTWAFVMNQIATPLKDETVVPQNGSVSLQAIINSSATFNRRMGWEYTLQVVPTTRIAVANDEMSQAFTRQKMGEASANSHIKFPDGWTPESMMIPEWERNLGIVAQVNGWDSQCLSPGAVTLSEMVARFMKRLTRRFGDYDGDGVVDVSFYCTGPFNQEPTGADWVAFRNASQGEFIFADWNFDGRFDGHEGPTVIQDPEIFGLDFSKFITGAIGGCP